MNKADLNGHINGFINFYKESGITSNQALTLIKRKLQMKKCGFAGTLDPFAEGVLPVGVNKATKSLPIIIDQDKIYICTALFGSATDSGDREGNIIKTSAFIPSREQIEKIIAEKFLGEIMQTPPVYSALKYKGKRLCDIMRLSQGNELEKMEKIVQDKTRAVKIYDFKIIGQLSQNQFQFEIKCGKGTYIRKLIVDLAEEVFSAAHLIALTRAAVGNFKLEDSVKINDLTLNDIKFN